MPLIWKLKTHRDERRNAESRDQIKRDLKEWIVRHSVNKEGVYFGQDVLANEVWLHFEPEYYYSLFALSWLGNPHYRRLEMPGDRIDPPDWAAYRTASKIVNLPTR